MLKAVSSITNAIGALNYKGTWNAATNSPSLASGVGIKGDYYAVSVAGGTNLDGTTLWGVGDWAVFNGSVWQKVDGGSTGLLTTLTVTGDTYLSTTSGSVGIGTTTPSAKLDIVGSTLTVAKLKGGSGTNQGSAYYIEQGGSTNILFAIGDNAAIFGGSPDASVAMYTPANIPFIFGVGGSEKMRITSAGNVVAGASAALATNATNGFLYVPTCAGTPTGVPTAITGMAPIVIDTTNNKLYFYSNGQWRDAGP